MGQTISKLFGNQDQREKIVLILGKRGSGKSALANFLLGQKKFETVSGFGSRGSGVNTATFENKHDEQLYIMEAPGLDDLFALCRDDSRLEQIVVAINMLLSRGKAVQIDSIMYVISANDPFSPEQRKLLSYLASRSNAPEKEFWPNVTVILSNASSIADTDAEQRSAIEAEAKSPHCSESFKWLMKRVGDNFLPVESLKDCDEYRQDKIGELLKRVSKAKQRYQGKWIADLLSYNISTKYYKSQQSTPTLGAMGPVASGSEQYESVSSTGAQQSAVAHKTSGVEQLRIAIGEQLRNPEVECFPEDAVTVTKEGMKYMKNLMIGDKVLCMTRKGDPVFSQVITFLHYEPSRPAEFLKLETEDARCCLVISKDHILLVANTQGKQFESVLAGSIKLGDSVIMLTNTERSPVSSRVTKITTVSQQGVYAPLTRSGTIIVNGILASCYANAPSHRVAHAAFAPLRIISHIRFSNNSTPTKHGVHAYATLLMTCFSGKLKYCGL